MSSLGKRSHRPNRGKAVLPIEATDREAIVVKSQVPSQCHTESTWEAPFDLEGIPTDLREKLVLAAPCLLGRSAAVHDQDFFHRVVGLCKEGCTPKEVTEKMVPANTYEETWPPGEGANKTRYLLDRCKDSKARDMYLRMYQRVYGDAPDNKAFSQTFLRACVYYYSGGRDNNVNWAAAAAKVNQERRAHAANNPQKLSPPALKQQMAGIISAVATYYLHNGVGTGARKVDALLKELQLQTSKLQQSASALDKKKLAHLGLHAQILALETEDERLNSMKEDLRRRSKKHATAGELQEKADVDKEQREISKAIAANNDALEAAQEEAATLASTLERDSSAYRSSQQQLRQLEKNCASERIAQHSIKPKRPVGKNMSEAGVPLKINLDSACRCCNYLFVSNCAVPYSCGCLFHPWCLFPALISGRGNCPLCGKLGDASWLESWGFDGLERSSLVSRDSKGKCLSSPEDSGFVKRMREDAGDAQGRPAPKVAKTKVKVKGPSPQPPISPFIPAFPHPKPLASRPAGSIQSEVVNVAVATLAHHSKF